MAEESTVLKSGPLFISSKGLGWTSWKKRWFILNRTSLVFYRSDPSTSNQKGAEANLTLGGIELNNSGSVVVKADKKLITVLFPDGRDGRAFTLKAETSEDLQEWKTALENALSQAPSLSLALGQNSIFRSDTLDVIESIPEQVSSFIGKDEEALKSTVAGGAVLLDLEDIDGNPSFLEKALCFIEQYGVKIEGILRQSADVEEVKRRVKEYEQGRNEFTADEDAHLIGDCIKYVLREVPSAAVPASCCTTLLEAFKSDRGARVSRMRAVIAKSFPESTRRLLQRILKMMKVVVSHKSENRMSVSAVAACMAPLLLRPLLAGECELDNNVDVGGDGSFQLLQAAAAANHAQAMVIIMLDEYEKIFSDDYLQEEYFSEVYSESEDADGEDEDYDDDDGDDDDEYYEGSSDNGIEEDNSDEDMDDEENVDTDCKPGRRRSGTSDESGDIESDFSDEASDSHNSSSGCSEEDVEKAEANKTTIDVAHASSSSQHETNTQIIHPATMHPSGSPKNNSGLGEKNISSSSPIKTNKNSGDLVLDERHAVSNSPILLDRKTEQVSGSKRSAVWGRAPGKKLSMESIDCTFDDETAIHSLEATKADLENRIEQEVKENELLQETLDKRKEALCERRLALQQDVQRLQEQLQRERNLRASLEAGLVSVKHGLPLSSSIDGKTRKDVEEIVHAEADIINLKQQVAVLHGQLKQKQQKHNDSPCQSHDQHHGSFKCVSTKETKEKQENKEEKLHRKMKPRSASLRMATYEEFGTNPTTTCDANSSRNENNLSSASCENEKSHTEDLRFQNRQLSKKQRQKTQKFGAKSLKARYNSSAGLCPAGSEMVSEDITRPKDSLLETNSRSLTVSNTQKQDSSHSQNRELLEDHHRISEAGSNCTDTNSSSKLPEPSVVSESASNVLDGEDISLVSESRKEKSPLPESSSSHNQQPCQNQQEKPCQIGKSTTEVGASSTENSSLGALNLALLKCTKGENSVLGRNFDSLKGQVLDSPPLRRRQPNKKQQPGLGNPSNLRSASPGSNNFALAEPSFSSSASTKKNSTRIEDALASTSTLTKLSNKFNFLKEKWVPNEPQAIDNGRGQCTDGPATKTNVR